MIINKKVLIVCILLLAIPLIINFKTATSEEERITDIETIIKILEEDIYNRLEEYSPNPLFSDMTIEDVKNGRKGDCSHTALWFAYYLDNNNIPFRVLDVKSKTANRNLLNHAMVEVFINGKWILTDPLNGWIYNKSIVELKKEPQSPINNGFRGRQDFEIYKSEIFFNNIYYVEAYEDLAYTGIFKSKKKDWKYNLITDYTVSDKVFNPNSFAPMIKENGLYLVDLNTGLLKVKGGNLEPISFSENLSFRLPAAIVEHGERLYIADYRNNRIVITNSSDFSFHSEWTHIEMSDPEGIAIDSHGNVYVASYGNGKILKFDSNGNLIKSWSNITGNINLVHPHGIFIKGNELYVTELSGNISIIVYDLEGNYLRKFGDDLEKEKQLKYPTTVWVDNDKVYVADAVAHQIKIFSKYGKYIDSIGKLGVGEGEFYYPYGVAVDEDGTILVGDTHNHRVQRFKSNGDYMYSIVRVEEEKPLRISDDKTIQNKELKVTWNILDKKNISSIEATDKNKLLMVSSSIGSIKSINSYDNKNNEILEGLIYPWNIQRSGDNLIILDEPGSLNIYDTNGLFRTSVNITAQQFDPTNSLNTFFYRPQDFRMKNELIVLANTLPGNIGVMSPYGDVYKVIDWKNDNSETPYTRTMPTSIDFYDEDTIITTDMFNDLVFLVNLQREEGEKLISPIDFTKPFDVAVNRDNNLVVVTEPSMDRIQIFNTNLDYIGKVTNDSIPELIRPQRISIGEDGKIYIVCEESIVIIDRPKNQPQNRANLEKIRIDISSTNKNNEKSLFLNMYNGINMKAKNYWSYYKDNNGIVKYDFNFSFLNFQIPVKPGYGPHTWSTGIGHYGLLSYYEWKNTGSLEAKEEFLKHAKWFYKNATYKQGVPVWVNNINLTLPTDSNEFISSSTQAAGAALLLKASDYVGVKESVEYKKMASTALEVLKIDYKDGGLKFETSDKETFYVEYPYKIVEAMEHDIQAFIWTLAFLYECGDIGEDLFKEGLLTFQNIYNSPVLEIDDISYWSNMYGNNVPSSVTSKYIYKFNESLKFVLQ